MQQHVSHNLPAEKADTLIGRDWFDGFARNVQCFSTPVHFQGDFDLLERAEAKGEVECLLFEKDLRIDGVMRLSEGVQSILVVLGDVHVHALELGDAMLAVAGGLYARDYIFAPPNEGVIELGPVVREKSKQEESWQPLPDLLSIHTPLFLFYDFEQKRHRLFCPDPPETTPPREVPESRWSAYIDPALFSTGGLEHEAARARLRHKKTLK